ARPGIPAKAGLFRLIHARFMGHGPPIPGTLHQTLVHRDSDEDETMPFHENLRTLRLARGLTQPMLAEKAGIEQCYLSKLENGRSKPSEDVLTRIAQALEVKPEALTQNGDEADERSRRWKRLGLTAAAAAVLAVTFMAGRATAVYPLSFGQVINGAGAPPNTPHAIPGMPPPRMPL